MSLMRGFEVVKGCWEGHRPEVWRLLLPPRRWTKPASFGGRWVGGWAQETT